MTDLTAGDLVFHYAHQRIMAVSHVRAPASTHLRPSELPSQLWQQDGWLAEVDYLDLVEPIHRSEIPVEWRRPRREPCFDVNGEVVMGYLFPVSEGFAGKLLERFKERWPPAAFSPTVSPVEARQGAYRLLRRLLGEPLETLTGRPNRILAVGTREATVATERSPEGQPVPIAEVQQALDQLLHDGQVVVTPERTGYRSAFIGAVLRTLPGTRVRLDPPRVLLDGGVEGNGRPLPEGDLDVAVTAVARREQGELRRRLTGGAAQGACAICGAVFPVDLLVAAHIKRRSLCTEAERRDLENVAMLACKFGCDALFEDGYLAVHQDGTILVATLADGLSQVVVERLHALGGRVCGSFTLGRAPYFGWHRHNVFLG
jgi:rhodanese-related sulfurtransferase